MNGLSELVLLDTNIFLDLIGGFEEKDTVSSKKLLDSIKAGEKLGIVIAPVLCELYYLISREGDEQEAQKFIKLILSIPNIQVFPIGQEEAIRAGWVYHKYNAGQKHKNWLSLVDCLIIASCFYLESSVVCTWDSRFEQVKDVSIYKPSEIVKSNTAP